MEKIANLKDIKRGESLEFKYKGKEALLVRIKEDGSRLVAYVAVCPHEGWDISWDEQINKLVCECHLSLFNVRDGSIYKHSSLFDELERARLNKGLTKIELKIDKNEDVYAV